MTRARSLSLLANSNIFTVDQSNSRVGIGSTIPDVKLDVNGNMNVSGTLTYEDVTNVNTAGITTTGGLVVTGLGATIGGITTFFGDLNFGAAGVGGTVTTLGHAEFAGIVTATSFSGDGSGLTGVASTDNINTSTLAQFTGGVGIADSIFHIEDSNTAIRFPAADTFTVETAGSEAIRVDSSQRLLVNITSEMETFGSAALQVATAAGGTLVLGRDDTSVSADNGIGAIYFDTKAGGSYAETAVISAEADADQGSNDYPSRLVFKTTADGASSVTERVRISSSGNVGINSTNPAYLLDIASGSASMRLNSTSTSTLVITSGASNAARIEFGDLANNDTGYIYYDNSDDSMQFATNGSTERLRITSAGVLQFASGGNLEMASNGRIFVGNGGNASDPMFANVSDTNTGIAFPAADTMLFATGGTERLRIDSSGRVGINSTVGSGTELLQIDGSGDDTAFVKLKRTNGAGDDSAYGGITVIDNSGNRIGRAEFRNQDSTTRSQFVISTYTSSSLGVRLRVRGDGTVLPGADNSQDLGSTSLRWANIYSADLQLSNEGSVNDVDGTWGKYTIQEGENDLFLLNRRNGKKYRFMLEEV